MYLLLALSAGPNLQLKVDERAALIPPQHKQHIAAVTRAQGHMANSTQHNTCHT